MGLGAKSTLTLGAKSTHLIKRILIDKREYNKNKENKIIKRIKYIK